jgi:pentapeptide MXKDX repeat protein
MAAFAQDQMKQDDTKSDQMKHETVKKDQKSKKTAKKDAMKKDNTKNNNMKKDENEEPLARRSALRARVLSPRQFSPPSSPITNCPTSRQGDDAAHLRPRRPLAAACRAPQSLSPDTFACIAGMGRSPRASPRAQSTYAACLGYE